jgi:hypothetical protein
VSDDETPGTTDHTAAMRDNIRRNLARVHAGLQVAHDHHDQIHAGLRRERDEAHRTIEHHRGRLANPMQGRWTSEDRADYERALARRHEIDVATHHDPAED